MATAKQKSSSAAHKRPVITRRDFIGMKMANFLYSMKHNSALDEHTRAEAEKLQKQWDGICPFRLNNPITAADLEKEFNSGEMKP